MSADHRRENADGRRDAVLSAEHDFADARARHNALALVLDERRPRHVALRQRTMVVELRSSVPRTAIAMRMITTMAAIAMIVHVVGLTVVVVVVVVDVDWLVAVVAAGLGA